MKIEFNVKNNVVFNLSLQPEELIFLEKFTRGGVSCKPSELRKIKEVIARLIILNIIQIKKGAQIVYFELTLIGKNLIKKLKEE